MSQKVAVVTGANRGLGYALVKGLCQRFDGIVYLTSRNEKRGKAAADRLKSQGLKPEYHKLDITDLESVTAFAEHLKTKNQGIDILINNAAEDAVIMGDKVKGTRKIIDTNYIGVLLLQDLLYPLLKDNSRVLNVVGDCGHLSNIRNQTWIDRLSKPNVSKTDIVEFLNWYIEGIVRKKFNNDDLADNGSIGAYRISKVALGVVTRIQQRQLASKGISVNSVHPGMISTAMNMGIGMFTPDEAAQTPLYIVLDAPQDLKGSYVWYDRKVVDWNDHKGDYYFQTRSIRTQLIRNFMNPSKWSSTPQVWITFIILIIVLFYKFLF